MNWIIVIVIAVLIIIMLMSFEHYTFDISDTNALNNITSVINDELIKSKNINISNEIKLNNQNIMDIIYPVESIFMSRKYYDLSKPETLTYTPLAFGKWIFIDDVGVIGTALSTHVMGDTLTETKSYGSRTINAEHLPSHGHKGLIGYSHGYDKNNSWYVIDGITNTKERGIGLVDDVITGEQIIKDINWTAGKYEYTKVNNNQNFEPYGYYFYTYRKISL